MSDLKPCPFCGSFDLGIESNGNLTWLICGNCHTKGPTSGKEAWNTRTEDEPIISNEAAELLLEHASVCCGNYDQENDELGCTCCGNVLNKKDGTGHASDCLAQLILESAGKPKPITPEMLIESGFRFEDSNCSSLKRYHMDFPLSFFPEAKQAWVLKGSEIHGPRTRAQLETLLECLGLSENQNKEASTTKPPKG